MSKLSQQINGFSMSGSPRSIVGTIHNLNIVPGEMGTALITWDYQSVINDAPEFGVFLDGRIVQRVAITARETSITGVSNGAHSIKVVPIRTDDDLSSYLGDPLGGRVYMRWPASPSRDTAFYKIWMRTSPSGTYALVDTVDTVTVEERTLLATTTGGRISYQGSPSVLVNETLTVTLNSDGAYAYANSDFTVTGTGTFGEGTTLHLPFGVLFTMHDDPGDYDADEISIHIGPASEWLSGPGLPTGVDLYFAISGVDTSGNDSADNGVRLGDAVFQLPVMPDPVLNVRWSWNNSTQVASLLFDLPASVDEARLYSNWDLNTNDFDPDGFVILDQPHTIVAYTAGNPQPCEWQFAATGLDGVLKVYVRTSIGATELEDATLHTFSLPPTPEEQNVILAGPADLKVRSKAAGRWSLSWSYEYSDEGVPALASFAIYAGATAEAIDWDAPLTTQTLSSLSGKGYPVATFSYDEPGTPAAVERWFGVRAVSGTGITTLNTQVVKFKPDVTAPTLIGSITGAVQ